VRKFRLEKRGAAEGKNGSVCRRAPAKRRTRGHTSANAHRCWGRIDGSRCRTHEGPPGLGPSPNRVPGFPCCCSYVRSLLEMLELPWQAPQQLEQDARRAGWGEVLDGLSFIIFRFISLATQPRIVFDFNLAFLIFFIVSRLFVFGQKTFLLH